MEYISQDKFYSTILYALRAIDNLHKIKALARQKCKPAVGVNLEMLRKMEKALRTLLKPEGEKII